MSESFRLCWNSLLYLLGSNFKRYFFLWSIASLDLLLVILLLRCCRWLSPSACVVQDGITTAGCCKPWGFGSDSAWKGFVSIPAPQRLRSSCVMGACVSPGVSWVTFWVQLQQSLSLLCAGWFCSAELCWWPGWWKMVELYCSVLAVSGKPITELSEHAAYPSI